MVDFTKLEERLYYDVHQPKGLTVYVGRLAYSEKIRIVNPKDLVSIGTYKHTTLYYSPRKSPLKEDKLDILREQLKAKGYL